MPTVDLEVFPEEVWKWPYIQDKYEVVETIEGDFKLRWMAQEAKMPTPWQLAWQESRSCLKLVLAHRSRTRSLTMAGDWYCSMKQYLVVVDGSFQEEIERIESNMTNEVDWDPMSKPEQERSRFLYSLLGSLLHGRLVGVVKNVESFNGWLPSGSVRGLFSSRLEPRSRTERAWKAGC